jgi:hypothetical protein
MINSEKIYNKNLRKTNKMVVLIIPGSTLEPFNDMFLEDECEKIDWDYDGAGQW